MAVHNGPAEPDEDAWQLALVQALGTYASDPAAARAAAWKVVASAPAVLSLRLIHTLQVLSAVLTFQFEGRFGPSPEQAFEQGMLASKPLKGERASPLTLLVPAMLDMRRRKASSAKATDEGLEALAALARDRSAFVSAQEAWWPTIMLADSLALANHLEAALPAAYHALALAEACNVEVYQYLSRLVLSYILISMADLDGALALLESGREPGNYGQGLLKSPLLSNHLLALLLSGRLADAAALDARHPQFDEQALEFRPGMRVAKAFLLLGLGQPEQALTLLGPQSTVKWVLQHKAVLANRCWIRARILLALDRPGEAVDECLQGLQCLEEHGFTLSPVNRSQIYQAASAGYTLLGNLEAAQAMAEQVHVSDRDSLKSATRARLLAVNWRSETPPQVQPAQPAHLALLEQLAQRVPERAAAEAPGADASLRMVALVSHEMRNPIAGVLGMTTLLQSTDLDDKQRRYLSLVRSSAEMLLSLCSDLLDMAQLDNARFVLRPALCDLGAAAEQACQTFAPHIASKGITLQLGIDRAALRAWVCDEMRFKQVLMNLVSNAVKFTPRDGRISVRVQLLAQPAHQVLVEVQDTGRGITADEQQRLFQDFSQLPNQTEHRSPDMAVQGAGLGLALCRRLVQQMRGEMGLRSTVGAGATFWFTMPALDEAAAADPGEDAAMLC